MDIIKIGAFALTAVFLGLQFKKEKPEISFLIAAAVCTMIFIGALSGIQEIWNNLKQAADWALIDNQYFKILFKVVGITYVCQFCADICRDTGNEAVASQVEIFGKISVLLLGIPVLTAVMNNIRSM